MTENAKTQSETRGSVILDTAEPRTAGAHSPPCVAGYFSIAVNANDTDAPICRELEELRGRLARLEALQARLEARVERLEASRMFRVLRRAGGYIRRQDRALRRSQLLDRLLPALPLYSRMLRALGAPPEGPQVLAEWLRAREHWYVESNNFAARRGTWSHLPVVGVVLRASKDARGMAAAIESLRAQSYPKWELSIAGDPSLDAEARRFFEEQTPGDARIHCDFSNAAQDWAALANAAAAVMGCEYLAFLEPGCVLVPHALDAVVETLQQGGANLVYADEAEFRGATPRRLLAKPGWSPDLLLSSMYLGGFFVVSRSAFEAAGGFHSEAGSAALYDLALRVTDGAPRVLHVPETLFHGTLGESAPTAPLDREADERHVLTQALSRRGIAAEVRTTAARRFALDYRMAEPPFASLIVCSRNAKLLGEFLHALRRTSYPCGYEIIVAEHRGSDDAALDRLLDRAGCIRVPYVGEFNFARMNNCAAQRAEGGILVFLNDDVAPLEPGWLSIMAGQLGQQRIGVAGAKLLYPSGTIQHAGIALGMGSGAGHPGRGHFRSDLFPWLDLTRDVSAVTGACLGIRRDLFRELGGFDEAFPVNFNDVDLCLRVRRMGLDVVIDPRVLLRHAELQTRSPGVPAAQRDLFLARWGEQVRAGDPFLPRAVDRWEEDLRLAPIPESN